MTETLDALLSGFAVALTPTNLFWGLLGVTLGTAVGVLPGVGPALTVAMLLPLTVKLDPTGALIMFAGIYYGAMYGGSTTTILLNTPGESASIATALEGNKMAKRGRAGPALATAAIGSFVAGTISVVLLTLLAPVVVCSSGCCWGWLASMRRRGRCGLHLVSPSCWTASMSSYLLSVYLRWARRCTERRTRAA